MAGLSWGRDHGVRFLFVTKMIWNRHGRGLKRGRSLLHYDRETQRAYVELKSNDPDGDEILTVVVFSFRTICRLSKPELERERPQR